MREDPKDAAQNTQCSIILIAGFLGAGKTTLLTHILRWVGNLSGTAILVNEFGSVGVDGQLVQNYRVPVVEMANGCICCSLQVDFRQGQEDILVRFAPNRLLIEATGVADLHDFLEIFNEKRFRQNFRPAGTVTVVDVDFREARENLGPLFYNRISAADLILLNKVDLEPAEAVTRFISEIKQAYPSAAIIPTHHCRIDPDALRGLQKQPDRPMETLLPMYAEKDHPCGSRHHHGESTAHSLGMCPFPWKRRRLSTKKVFAGLWPTPRPISIA